MELEELARGTWSDALRALSRECAGGAARVGSPGAAGSSRPASPLSWSLHAVLYDEQRRELEVLVALAGGGPPSLRCFVRDPRRLWVARCGTGPSILAEDGSGERTLIRLAGARDHPAPAADGPVGDEAGDPAMAGVGA